MKKKKPYLSVVVPLYNEHKRLANLCEIYKYLKTKRFETELLVVNDGSNDKTLSLLKKLGEEIPLTIVTYKENKGKGYAVKTGMLAASGTYRLFTDVDLSTPIKVCDIFLSKANRYPVVIGTRKHKKAHVIIHQPKVRELMGKTYTSLVNGILNLSISDFTCGFKCFTENAAIDIFSKITTNRWSFDAEVIFLAKHLGYRVFEVPLSWSHEADTKVKLPRDAIYSFIELLRIRLNILLGKYSKK
jgi:dolichyl-phosphate beta-glucosyltransferase